MNTRPAPRTRFALPAELSATEPPEARGIPRDGVRLLVAHADRPLRHRRFRDLPAALLPGDLVVVNTSATAPAAVDGVRAGRAVTVHVSGPVPGEAELLVVELRSPAGGRLSDAAAGQTVTLPAGGRVELVAGYPDPGTPHGRLWRARLLVGADPVRWLDRHGRPITYSHVRGRWPIEDYRTVFAKPGHGGQPAAEFPSAEMPSAGRPFTRGVLDRLAGRGVGVAELVLHAGVSSPEPDEVPLPERYRVPPRTADAVNTARAAGRRVVAVGTTVTRALETVAGPDGVVRAGSGWTDLVLGPDRPARVVDALVTGWHEPEASHLLLLEAVAGTDLVARAYAAALAEGYLWHEFGDSCLLVAGHRTPN